METRHTAFRSTSISRVGLRRSLGARSRDGESRADRAIALQCATHRASRRSARASPSRDIERVVARDVARETPASMRRRGDGGARRWANERDSKFSNVERRDSEGIARANGMDKGEKEEKNEKRGVARAAGARGDARESADAGGARASDGSERGAWFARATGDERARTNDGVIDEYAWDNRRRLSTCARDTE